MVYMGRPKIEPQNWSACCPRDSTKQAKERMNTYKETRDAIVAQIEEEKKKYKATMTEHNIYDIYEEAHCKAYDLFVNMPIKRELVKATRTYMEKDAHIKLTNIRIFNAYGWYKDLKKRIHRYIKDDSPYDIFCSRYARLDDSYIAEHFDNTEFQFSEYDVIVFYSKDDITFIIELDDERKKHFPNYDIDENWTGRGVFQREDIKRILINDFIKEHRQHCYAVLTKFHCLQD